MECSRVRGYIGFRIPLTLGFIPDRSSLPPSGTETHTHLAHSLVRYLGVSSPAELAQYGLTSAGDLVDFVSRVSLFLFLQFLAGRDSLTYQFTTNTFTLTSPSLTPLGVTVSPLIALINHSCDPNAVVVFPRSNNDSSKEPMMHLVALREIAENEEVRQFFFMITASLSLHR